MTRRDISLTISLCASLIVHALLLVMVADTFTRQFALSLHLPPLLFPVQMAPWIVDQSDPFQRLGDSSGNGDAIQASPGDTPLQAKQAAQAQPFMSLDPVGQGDINDEPTQSALPKGQGQPEQSQSQSQPVAEQNQELTPSPFGLAQAMNEPPMPMSRPQPPIPQGGASSADPAPQGDSESDPVSTVGSVEFHAGSTDVRLGRQHKITRPRLSLAARADLITLKAPVVVLKIKTDPTGKVTNVQVYRSSGSAEVDQPCKLAAYQWWFEPPKDANGKPVADVLLFAIHFI